MSLVKYRLKEVATDFGVAPKEIAEIISKFFEKPKSNTQVLTEEELNVIFDYYTQVNQISTLEAVFAVQPKPKAEEPKVETPKAEEKKPAETEKKAAPAAEKKVDAPKAEPKKPAEPERKRERRVVDTSAVQVNSARFDDRVDDLVSERVQNYQGGKQRIGGKKGQQQKARYCAGYDNGCTNHWLTSVIEHLSRYRTRLLRHCCLGEQQGNDAERCVNYTV